VLSPEKRYQCSPITTGLHFSLEPNFSLQVFFVKRFFKLNTRVTGSAKKYDAGSVLLAANIWEDMRKGSWEWTRIVFVSRHCNTHQNQLGLVLLYDSCIVLTKQVCDKKIDWSKRNLQQRWEISREELAL